MNTALCVFIGIGIVCFALVYGCCYVSGGISRAEERRGDHLRDRWR
ncbi:MAG: hypothetical protein H5T69_04165 [Chloroflexi bacterium]|nr:hypothetical protein [Chloroflexota bacterium]